MSLKDKQVRVHFIGAGPGDPELITVKGKRLLQEADVVVYAGSLVKERVLEYASSNAEIYNSASMSLEEIMDIMVKAVRGGKRVVRVHSGDPTLYSALREQIDILESEDIPYEVVPGINSAFGAAASLKEELTLPGITQTVIFTRLEGRTPVPDRESLSLLAQHGATICIFLSVGMIDRVVEELRTGYSEETPVAVVYRATWEDEKVIRGCLKDIPEKVKDAGITRQAVIIVGRALRTRSGKGSVSKGSRSRLYDRDFEHGYRKKG